MDSIPDILEDLRQGKMIVLVDDEDRENEGDLVCAAQHVNPDVINFMLRVGRGMLCVALSGQKCDHLQLPPQSVINTSQHSTAYTVTVDAHEKFGVTTGVSTSDRAATITQLAQPDAKAEDFAKPGHVQPLRAREGGVLVRCGQTEGSVDLCRLAGLSEAAAIIEVMNEDGSMARRPELEILCKQHQLKMCSVAELVQYRLKREQLIHRTHVEPFHSEFGRFNLIVYRDDCDPLPHIALTLGDIGQLDDRGHPRVNPKPILVRMHSQNLLGDLFADRSNPSGRTLHAAMRLIQKEGTGAVVYLRHEMVGHGMLAQLHAIHLPQDQKSPPPIQQPQKPSSDIPLPHRPVYKGAHGIGCQILRDLGIRRIKLITSHPFQPNALDGFGLHIDSFVNPELNSDSQSA